MKGFLGNPSWAIPEKYHLSLGPHGSEASRTFYLGMNDGLPILYTSSAIFTEDAIKEVRAFAKKHKLKLPRRMK